MSRHVISRAYEADPAAEAEYGAQLKATDLSSLDNNMVVVRIVDAAIHPIRTGGQDRLAYRQSLGLEGLLLLAGFVGLAD